MKLCHAMTSGLTRQTVILLEFLFAGGKDGSCGAFTIAYVVMEIGSPQAACDEGLGNAYWARAL